MELPESHAGCRQRLALGGLRFRAGARAVARWCPGQARQGGASYRAADDQSAEKQIRATGWHSHTPLARALARRTRRSPGLEFADETGRRLADELARQFDRLSSISANCLDDLQEISAIAGARAAGVTVV